MDPKISSWTRVGSGKNRTNTRVCRSHGRKAASGHRGREEATLARSWCPYIITATLGEDVHVVSKLETPVRKETQLDSKESSFCWLKLPLRTQGSAPNMAARQFNISLFTSEVLMLMLWTIVFPLIPRGPHVIKWTIFPCHQEKFSSCDLRIILCPEASCIFLSPTLLPIG